MFRQAGVPPGDQDRVRGQQAADAGDLVPDGRQPQHGPRLLLDLQQQHQHHGHSGELIHGFYSFKTAFYVYCDNDDTTIGTNSMDLDMSDAGYLLAASFIFSLILRGCDATAPDRN